MQRAFVATLLSFALAVPAVAQAQAPDWKQALGGLLSGNQDRDQALQQAYERGYQRGRDDEARQAQRQPYGRGNYDNGYDRDRGSSYGR